MKKTKMPFLSWVACGALIWLSGNLLVKVLTHGNPLISQRIYLGITVVLVVGLILGLLITLFKEMGWGHAWWKRRRK